MNSMADYKWVATIDQGYKTYYYALYDEDIAPGDKVAVSGIASKQIWAVKEVLSKEEARKMYPGSITAEVICKVDTSRYDERVAKREEADKLKKEMNRKIKEMQEVDKYEVYADKSPELRVLLERYKQLVAQ